MKNKLYILFIIVLILIGIYALWPKEETINIQNPPARISEGPITERGTIVCIPKLGTGAQTMECMLGLKNTAGIHYGLRDLSKHNDNLSLISPEILVEVKGMLISEETFGPDGNKYDTIGTIEIESISEI
jgi:hypothetical protein